MIILVINNFYFVKFNIITNNILIKIGR